MTQKRLLICRSSGGPFRHKCELQIVRGIGVSEFHPIPYALLEAGWTACRNVTQIGNSGIEWTLRLVEVAFSGQPQLTFAGRMRLSLRTLRRNEQSGPRIMV